MKKKLLVLALLAMTPLASCTGTETESSLSSVTPSDSSAVTSEPISESLPQDSSSEESVPEVELPEISVDAAEGVTFDFIEGAEGECEPGSEVSFTLTVASDHELSGVSLDGKELTADSQGVYSFTMPNHDVALKAEAILLGDSSLLASPDVAEADLPEDLTDVEAALQEALEVEPEYFASGTYKADSDGGAFEIMDLSVTAGRNDVLRIEGNKAESFAASSSSHFYEERGIDSGYYYDFTDSASPDEDYYDNEFGSGAQRLDSYALVADPAEGEEEPVLESDQMLTSEAKAKVGAYGFAGVFLEKAFDEGGGLTSSYDTWTDATLTATLASDKKSYTVNITAYESDYYDSSTYDYFEVKHELSLTFDGVGFLTEGKLLNSYYYEDSLNSSTGLPYEDALPVFTESTSTEAVRGFKKTLEKRISLPDLAMDDYDVKVFYEQSEWGYDSDPVYDGNTVEKGATLSFAFTSKDTHEYYLKPRFVGAKEEGFVKVDTDGSIVVEQTGEFHLIFDNGFGKTKEVAVTATEPKAKEITATLSSDFTYIGESVTVTASVTPSEASNASTLEVRDEASEGAVTITPSATEVGVFTVTGTAAGEVTLVLSSVDDPSVQTEIKIDIIAKPDAASLRAALPTKTYTYNSDEYSDYDVFMLNFNEDGTGEFLYGYKSYGTSYKNLASFTWTLDDETLAFTIISTEASDDYTFTACSAFSVDALDCSFDGEYRDRTCRLVSGERKDLALLANTEDYGW